MDRDMNTSLSRACSLTLFPTLHCFHTKRYFYMYICIYVYIYIYIYTLIHYIYNEAVPADHCLFLDGQSSPQTAMGRCPFSSSVYSQILHLQNPNHNRAAQHPN